MAPQRLLVVETLAVGSVETILKLVLARDVVLYHSAVLLFEFVRHVATFKTLAAIVRRKLNSTL